MVLVHGYSTPYFIYEKVFARLVELGYKVIRYDLYGRGFSDRVPGKHTPAFFARGRIAFNVLNNSLLEVTFGPLGRYHNLPSGGVCFSKIV